MDLIEKMYEAINKQDERKQGIHVTSLVYDCLRRSYYSEKFGEGFFDIKTLITFWIGRVLHHTQVLKEHELQLEWLGILGTVDEFEDGILLEKKTTAFMPKAPLEHHVTQLEYYKLLLEKTGKRVKQMFLMYIDIANKDIKVFEVEPRPLAEIEVELIAKKTELEASLLKNIVPPRHAGWLCGYCNFASICFKGKENEV